MEKEKILIRVNLLLDVFRCGPQTFSFCYGGPFASEYLQLIKVRDV
uniref:Uncharacterized protein n=1 Tax=Rhizophora mucronata TaxID=61149 RepID=A0A2P2PFP5_RHIMU